MQRLGTGLLGLWVAACSCSQAPAPAEGPAPVPPEPAPVEITTAEPPAPEPPPLPAGPIVTSQSARAHDLAQQRMIGDERLPALERVPEILPPAPAIVRVGASAVGPDSLGEPAESMADDPPAATDPAATSDEFSAEPMPGWFVPLTEPHEGDALASFHAALRALAEGRDPDGKVRVAMYGASGTAADISVGYLRTYLQARFGDGGPGFVPLVPLTKWYRHNELAVKSSKGWTKEHAQIRKGRLDGHYGLLGASFYATAPKRWTEVGPKKGSTSGQGIAEVELFYLRQPGGGSFQVRVDDGPPESVSTAADAIEPGYHTLSMPPGPHSVRIETVDEAEVRVFGVVLERREPGVVVDVLGIDGTRGTNHLTWNEALWADNLRRRAPDLYTLSYGTNESVDEALSIPLYAEDLREQLRRFRRALPQASCVLLGPVDFPIRKDGQLLPRPVLREIIEVQRQVAAEEGCGFWDGVVFMGGELSMERWVSTDPPLARNDYLHFHRRGGVRKGMALADALMYRFDAQPLPLLELETEDDVVLAGGPTDALPSTVPTQP
ncbi:GDSL-type esterase/lipase family protein [Paraliomyxa miuraensis]|uniref:GDSL-type esterase/lipase family protein n=1 Tax=Paraliomyxa miuraensis TaxID=376150 RepID=UPI00224EBC7B|nr:GDSL-type esterase/lipase family protein [Paraliomyxa miuraensis]MCX4244844.1 GDSL-type esterase/lipase family protein [Paraliomyxa miuraensis]